jgi:hypothetical protein
MHPLVDGAHYNHVDHVDQHYCRHRLPPWGSSIAATAASSTRRDVRNALVKRPYLSCSAATSVEGHYEHVGPLQIDCSTGM